MAESLVPSMTPSARRVLAATRPLSVLTYDERSRGLDMSCLCNLLKDVFVVSGQKGGDIQHRACGECGPQNDSDGIHDLDQCVY